MEYFNGYKVIEASSLEKLNNLSQTEANNLACGPQDLFKDKLREINRYLGVWDIKPIEVTPKWNWKPGSYDKMKEYMYKTLHFHKRSTNMERLVNKIRDRHYYTGRMVQLTHHLETERANLKRLGVSMNVDLDKFKEQCNEFVNKILTECSKIPQLTNNQVSITPCIYLTNNSNVDTLFYLDIKLKGLSLSVYENNSLLQDIPMEDIHIIIHEPLRKKVNGSAYTIKAIGKYKSAYNLMHPYISTRGIDNSAYGTVCLDNHFEDVQNACRENNYVKLSMCLINWAQYYNIKQSNPYNQPYRTHIGLPENFSKAYKAIQDIKSIQTTCSNAIKHVVKKEYTDYITQIKSEKSICDKYNCSIAETCFASKNTNRILNFIDSDKAYEIEGMVGFLVEYMFKYCENNVTSISYYVRDVIGNCNECIEYADIDEFKTEIIHNMYKYYIKVGGFDSYLYNYLDKHNMLIKEEVKPAVPADINEEMKMIMKTWANAQ